MRIAIFVDYYLPHIGGVETSVYNQQRALKAAGHEVFVVTNNMKGTGHVKDDKENVIRLQSLFNFFYDGIGIYLYPRKKHYKIIDRLKPDVIHAETEENLAIFAARYAKSRGLPFIYTAHTFLTPQMSMLMPFPRTLSVLAGLRQKLFLRSLRPKLRVTPKDGLYGIPCQGFANRKILKVWMNFASLADAVIAPSKRMIDFVDHFVPGSPKYVIPNPFESIMMQSKSVEPAHEPIRVISSFVLRPEKRPEILVEAYLLLTPEERQKLKIDMYGGGILLNKMRHMIEQYGLKNDITLHGSVSTQELHEAKMNSDVMVSTSYGFDNQPMMFLEALAAGCAIMFCDPYLKEGTSAGNSILVEPSAHGFATGLKKLINNPKNLSAMKVASKHDAHNFNYKAFAEKYNQVLADLINPKA